MPAPLKITLSNCLDALPVCIESVEAYLQSQGANKDDINRTELIIEELVTNTIKYGYKDSRTHEISIKLSLTPKNICLQIIDDADPFDPTTTRPQQINIDSNLEKREIGGIGLLLVKKLATSFGYERVGRMNKQTITLKRNRA